MDGAPVGVESLWPSVIQVHPQQVQASSGWMVCRWVLITLAQCDLMETSVQASSEWMVRRRVLNHSSPV